MRCPYCAEDVRNDAVVCKHCHSELSVVKPLLQKINEMSARLVSLEQTASHAEIEAPDLARHAPTRHHGRGLTTLESVALAYISLVVVHFLINVKFDLKLIYFQISSIVVPLIFGLLWRESEKKMLSTGLLLGLAIAATAIASELAVISAVEKVPFLPKDAYEWKDLAFHSASMAFGFLTGVFLRQMLMANYVSNAKSNRTIEWLTRFIVEQFMDGKPRFTLKTIRSTVSSILGFSSAIVSILTGLWEYLLK